VESAVVWLYRDPVHLNAKHKICRLKAYFHYGCALRCVVLRGERYRDADGVSISLATHRKKRNATRSRN